MKRSDQRCALITGSAGGIGQALCVAFRVAGYRVIATDRVKVKGEYDEFIRLDLRQFVENAKQRGEFRRQVQNAAARSPLGVIINNAALQVVRDAGELSARDIRWSMAVNLEAPFLLVSTFLGDLERSRGSVINIGSVHSRLTKPGFAAYAASKAGLAGLTRSLAVELGPRGIRVNMICPAATRTPMLAQGFRGKSGRLNRLAGHHPLQRIAETSEIADLAVFLASDKAGFMTGAAVDIDGGISARLHDPD